MQIHSLVEEDSLLSEPDDDKTPEFHNSQPRKETSFINKKSKRMFSRKDKKMIKEEEYNPASYLEMMRYATTFDWFLIAIGLVTASICGAIGPAGCIIFKGITNTLMKGQTDLNENTLDMSWFSDEMIFYIQMYFYLGLSIFILEYIFMACFFTVCERQVHRIRQKYLSTILNQDIGWFEANEVGKLTQKMSSGIDRIQVGASDKIVILVQAFSAQIAGIIISFTLSWQLTLMMLFVVPFVILSIWGSARSVKKALRKEVQAYGLAGAVAEEVINGIRTVLAFNGQEFESDRYNSLLLKGCKSGIRKAFFNAFFTGLYLTILFGSMGIAFWFGTNLVIDGYTSPGTVFAVFWSVLIGSMQLGQALPQIGTLMSARIAAGEIFSIIDRKPNLDCSSNVGVKPEKIEGKIEFSDIHFTYASRPNVKILNGVSFVVEPGQTVALVGHSGCGKSTMINLLLRFYEQSQGSIMIDGIPLEDLNVNWLRNSIGFVSQEPIIFATTLEENLRMGGNENFTEKDMLEACINANAHEFISKLPNGYQTRIGEGGIRLSGGQKQRLAIARALIKNPKILLLDEATSALDTQSEKIVQEAIEQASSGRSILTVAHRLSTIRNANRIIVFDHGNIVEAGTHSDLMEYGGVYKQLVLAQEISKDGLHEEDSIIEDSKEEHSPIKQAEDDRMARASRRLRESMASNASLAIAPVNPPDVNDKLDELKEENATEASLLDIWRFARNERRIIFLGLIATFFRGFSTPIFSILYGRLFNSLSAVFSSEKTDIAGENMINAICFGILGIFAGVTTFFSGTLFGWVGEKLSMRLRSQVFRNLLRQDGKFYDDLKHSTGKLTARLASDAPNVQAAIDQRLAEVLQGLIALICGISIAFYFGWTMAPIGIFTAIFIVIIQLILAGYLKKRSQKDIEIAEEASRIAAESIEYVRTVQALTLQKHLNLMFCAASERPHRRSLVRGLLQATNYSLMASFINFNFACAYLFGLLLIKHGYTTPFVVFQVIEALNLASMSIMNVANYFPEYLRARVSAGLMFKMMNDVPQIDSMSDKGKKPQIDGKISLRNVHFAYPTNAKQMVLNNFSVNTEHGQTLALVGPSGCGKSTTIQLLERYYDVISGSLEIDNVDIREMNIRHLRQNMAIVGQEPVLFNLTIGQNISYGHEATEEQIIEAAKQANVHDFIDSLPKKYDTMCGGRGTQLSGGQRQRICIARAIIRNPKILLLDESTSALDTQSEKIVQAALDKARLGRTCITIAHRLSTIQNADSIAVVKDGKLAEIGDHKQLFNRRGLYHRLVQKQSS